MFGRFVLARSAGVEVSDSPSVGRAKPADGPAISDCCLEELYGFLVGGGVAGAWGHGAWGGGVEFYLGEHFLIASYCLVVVAVRRALALVSWKRVRPLFVATSSILSSWLSRAWTAKSPVGVVAAADAA